MINVKKNLIIDGNYILNKNTFSLHKAKLLYGDLYRSLDNTINSYCNWYPFDNIYFVSDSKTSWRKKLYDDYKGQRVKNDEIDWEFVYTAYAEFKDDMSKRPNITVLEKDSIEGDDWIAHIINESNHTATSNIFVSNDYDMKQMVKFSIDPLYINIMSNEHNGNEKVFISKDYEVFLAELARHRSSDLFELNDNDSFYSFLVNFIERRTIVESDPVETLITKMVSGDKSDNIKSCYTALTKTGKPRGVGDKGAEKIYARYLEEFGVPDLSDPDLYENLADLVCENKKAPLSNMDEIEEKLRFNRKLIDLNYLPKKIIDLMEEELNPTLQSSDDTF